MNFITALKMKFYAYKNAKRNAEAVERLKMEIHYHLIDLDRYSKFNVVEEEKNCALILDILEGILTGTTGSHCKDVENRLEKRYKGDKP